MTMTKKELESALAEARKERDEWEDAAGRMHEEWNRAVDRHQAAESRVSTLRAALGSCIWVLNNRHNKNTDKWEDYAKAAEKDARAALSEQDSGLSGGSGSCQRVSPPAECDEATERQPRCDSCGRKIKPGPCPHCKLASPFSEQDKGEE